MVRLLSSLNTHKKQVCFRFSFFFSTVSLANPSLSSLSNSTPHIIKTATDISSIDCTGIAKSIISKCSHFIESNNIKSYANASLKDLLLDLSKVIPHLTRRFRRILKLSPENVLEILMGFEFESRKVGFDAKKVETLWELFNLGHKLDKGFKHLPQSYEVMASMLLKVGMVREIELLILTMENRGISFCSVGTLDDLIGIYVGIGETQRACSVYDRMRGKGLVPSLSCYSVLLQHLVQVRETQLAFQICLEMVEMGINVCDIGNSCFENIVRLLCTDVRIQEARNLIKNTIHLGFEPSSSILYEIACGYCEKHDFEDLLGFFVEIKCLPDQVSGNKIINTLCEIFCSERAELFRQELELSGFQSNEITFGILIGWSCRIGNLRNAFFYLDETLSRGLRPSVSSYNSLICGLFMKGLWENARVIFDEMAAIHTMPNLTTFKILLAGYCKFRRFDEAKNMITEMVNCGLIKSSSLKDPISKVFKIIGIDPSSVKLRRDNDVGFRNTEFLDSIGNGLYLDTDIDEFNKKVNKVIQMLTIIDYNSLLMNECSNQNYNAATIVIKDMVQWGQSPILSGFSTLLKGLCGSRPKIGAISHLLDAFPKLTNLLDEETLNLLVQAYYKKGFTHKGRILLNAMLQRNLTTHSTTYLILVLCKKQTDKEFRDLWARARENKWLPELEDCKLLVETLYRNTMVSEIAELFENMVLANPRLRLDICHIFLQELCVLGFTDFSHVLFEELLNRSFVLDNVACSHLLRSLCTEKRFSAAFRILDSMISKNLLPCLDVSVILVHQLCKAGSFEKARALWKLGYGEDLIISSALTKAFCMSGKIEEATKLVNDMLEKGQVLETENCNIIFQGYCKSGKVYELLSVMIRMNFSLSISSYRNFVRSMCKQNRFLVALSLKEFLLRQNNLDALLICNILLYYLFSAGKISLVKEILQDMQKNGFSLDEVTYNFLICGFAQCKEISSSVQCLYTMISKGLRPSDRSLRKVLCSLCELGEFKEALNLSREMESRYQIFNSLVQNSIVEGSVLDGQIEEAEEFLGRMVSSPKTHNRIDYNNLIKLFCRYKRLNMAVDLLNVMLKKGNIPCSSTYNFVVRSFCSCDNLDIAMDFHTEMLDRDLKPSIESWNLLVHKFCQHGFSKEAERLLISMVQLGEKPSREVYSSLMNQYRAENNLRKASEIAQLMQRNGYDPDFDTHWSLISNFSNSSGKEMDKDIRGSSKGFLSRLLSGSGFA